MQYLVMTVGEEFHVPFAVTRFQGYEPQAVNITLRYDPNIIQLNGLEDEDSAGIVTENIGEWQDCTVKITVHNTGRATALRFTALQATDGPIAIPVQKFLCNDLGTGEYEPIIAGIIQKEAFDNMNLSPQLLNADKISIENIPNVPQIGFHIEIHPYKPTA